VPNLVPGAIWQPVDVGNRAKRTKGRGLCGHVAVSSSKNLVPGPLATRSADWHFYLPKDGAAIQYIDLDLQCWATGAGNATMVAFESEGGLGTEAQVNAEPWTDNQLTWAARILRHLHDTEGVPLRVMESSALSERGFGTHRLGIVGYMTTGEVWSSARGKSCPGTAKHNQRAEVVRRAGVIGTTQEDDMTPEQEAKLDRATNAAEGVWRMLKGSHADNSDRLTDLWSAVMAIQGPQASDPQAIAAALARLLPADIARQVADELAARLSP
jgi:hypothetical protein